MAKQCVCRTRRDRKIPALVYTPHISDESPWLQQGGNLRLHPPTFQTSLPPLPVGGRGDSVTPEQLLIGWQPVKEVNQLFEFVLMHNDVATREEKTLLRLERLEDLAFFKSRAHCCKKKGQCMQGQSGRSVSEELEVTCLIPFNIKNRTTFCPLDAFSHYLPIPTGN